MKLLQLVPILMKKTRTMTGLLCLGGYCVLHCRSHSITQQPFTSIFMILSQKFAFCYRKQDLYVYHHLLVRRFMYNFSFACYILSETLLSK